MEKREIICIGCPLGCRMSVEVENNQVLSVTGNTCIRGDRYARKEITNPERMVTSTVRVKGGIHPVVSIKTKREIPKTKIFECMRELKYIEVAAPISIGDVILDNVAGTKIAIVATKSVEALTKLK